ncbi:CPBP family intramembrane glutamic endopeptidase [Cyanobacterium aponinum]|uniref:CPBP family glutamic-type intramembrane protease n=1 Tax=Cyanobacterium aponinum AL20115 TaxID=3090662 RepID=A0AAF1C3A1_9CHRO|nr:type II CAAX endopeptidase family protein [Cyanobacterium aponinum]PHV62249.1 CPBP family intramembrane metalloprotease domain-containing protein [Cyanobacterium aponinum IPPAS B-1201]WPF89543.1 CPBP family glutamic-type intramembrane protease [Cyanobacterium aponinum AL20115]
MNLKRSLLIILTAISLYSVFFALTQSLTETQIQSRLELYQTNLILNASEWQPSSDNQKSFTQNLLGNNPYLIAQEQYNNILTEAESVKGSEKISNQEDKAIASETPRKQLKQEIQENQAFIEDLKIKLGIIYAYQENNDKAIAYWQEINDKSTAEILNSIWINNSDISVNKQEIIEKKLNGWFENITLSKLYAIENNLNKLEEINNKTQELAEKAIKRLLLLSVIPVVGGLIGFGLIIFLIVQLALKKEESILATNAGKTWDSPWDWEIIGQVLIVGFFFLSQILLPILIGVSGFNPTDLDIKGKALYVLVTYLLMAGGGLSVLYLSIKSFFPLPTDWFKLTNKNWFWWGLGGYLTAIPLVFFVSLLNQQIWQGKGGSNPLLMLALESQDKFALIIFFITASIAAPIFEEIIFRGFLLPSLTRYMSVGSAIVVSGIIFAIAHLSLAEALPLAVLGIILGIVYTRSGCLLASIMVHSLWNSGTLFSLFLLGSKLS